MKAGNLKFLKYLIPILAISADLYAEEKINLQIIQPTFEEEQEIPEDQNTNAYKLKSKKKLEISSSDSFVKIRALDKITAKTKDMNITIGKKQRFGYLEIFPRKCNKIQDQNNSGVAAYIQVKDLSDKKEDKVFVFNGWAFSTSTNLRTFDHPIYDLWVTGCENI